MALLLSAEMMVLFVCHDVVSLRAKCNMRQGNMKDSEQIADFLVNRIGQIYERPGQ